MARAFDAVTIDVGGVLVVPDHVALADALAAAGLAVDAARFWDGHYAAMHEVDTRRSEPESFADYVPAFCHFVGFTDDDAHAAAVAAIAPLFGPSAIWRQVIDDSIDGLGRLAAASIPRAILSNADGSIERHLRAHSICQVGDGPGVPVDHIVDSGAFGHAKPDRRIFDETVRLLGSDPARTVHVGDSVLYDVEGALAAGLQARHFDPQGLCERTDHLHLRALGGLLDEWGR